MAAILCVITSSPLKMKMAFIHTKMSFHYEEWSSQAGGPWYVGIYVCMHACRLTVCLCVCVHLCPLMCVCVCVTAGSQIHLFELPLPSGTAAQSGSSVFSRLTFELFTFHSAQLKLEVRIWHNNLKTIPWLLIYNLLYIRNIWKLQMRSGDVQVRFKPDSKHSKPYKFTNSDCITDILKMRMRN